MGDTVAFRLSAAVPPNAGQVVRIEWDEDGDGEFEDGAAPDEIAVDITACRTHTYEEAGVYFAVARVTAQRDGDPDADDGLVQNLARVRVTVE